MGTNYVIKGTVSELTVKKADNKTEVTVKISGSEGYAIKQGDKIYNVFCPKDFQNAGKTVQSYIADPETEITVNNNFENILTQASIHGKKIRLTVSESTLKKHIQESAPTQELNSSDPAHQDAKGKNEVDITSVSLLQK